MTTTTCKNCSKELDSYLWFNGPVCKECLEILSAGPEKGHSLSAG